MTLRPFWIFGLLLMVAFPILAQDPPPPPPPVPSPLERLVYIPFKNLQQVFANQDASVVMPYGEWIKLWDLAQGVAKVNRAPAEVVLSKSHYQGRIDNNLARLKATYTIRVLEDRWVELPLQFGDASVGEIKSADERVVLRGISEGVYGLLFPAKGTYQVELELIAKVHTSTDGKSFSLPCPVSGITSLELEVPSPDQTIEVSRIQASEGLEAGANATKISANLGATKSIEARWYPRVSQTPEMELLASIDNTTAVRIADGLAYTTTTLNYRVLRGQLDLVKFVVPVGHRILEVNAPGIKGWKVEQEAKRQLVTVELLSGEAKQVPVEIQTERTVGAEAIDLGGLGEEGAAWGIHGIGAVRESGYLLVGHGGDVGLTIENQQGLVRLDHIEVPENLRGRPFNYRFYSPSFRYQVLVEPLKPRLDVTQRNQLLVGEDEIQVVANSKITIERAGVFEVRYAVPEGLSVERVEGDAYKEHTLSADGKMLSIAFREKTIGESNLQIRGRYPLVGDEKSRSLKLPLFEPTGVDRERGHVVVFAQSAIEVVTDEKSLVGVQPVRVDQVGVDTSKFSSFPQDVAVGASWEYTRRPIDLPVTLIRRPTVLTAEVVSSVQVQQAVVEVSSTLRYKVEYAGLDTFRFLVPASAPAEIQIEPVSAGSPAIKQRTRDTEAEDGWIGWTVVMQREVVGDQWFLVRYEIAPERTEKDVKFDYAPPQVVSAVESNDQAASILRRGEIAINKDRIWSLSTSVTGAEPIDVRELVLHSPDASLAYRYSKQPVSIQVTGTKHELQEVVETVISRGLIEAVVAQDETTTVRARYVLKTSERQRLGLLLPSGVEMLGTVVGEKSVTLERDSEGNPPPGFDSYFVNVARTQSADESFSLTLIYRQTQKVFADRFLGGKLLLPFPKIGARSETTTAATQQMRVVVWVPDQYSLVGTPDHFTLAFERSFGDWVFNRAPRPVDTSIIEQWIGRTGSALFEFPTGGHGYEYRNLGGTDSVEVSWWRTTWVTWIVSLGVLLACLVLSRTSWENRIGIVILLSVVCALGLMSDSSFVVYWLQTASFGILGGGALWVVRSLALIPGAIGSQEPQVVLVASPELTPSSLPKADSVPQAPDQAGNKDQTPQEPPAV